MTLKNRTSYVAHLMLKSKTSGGIHLMIKNMICCHIFLTPEHTEIWKIVWPTRWGILRVRRRKHPIKQNTYSADFSLQWIQSRNFSHFFTSINGQSHSCTFIESAKCHLHEEKKSRVSFGKFLRSS